MLPVVRDRDLDPFISLDQTYVNEWDRVNSLKMTIRLMRLSNGGSRNIFQDGHYWPKFNKNIISYIDQNIHTHTNT